MFSLNWYLPRYAALVDTSSRDSNNDPQIRAAAQAYCLLAAPLINLKGNLPGSPYAYPELCSASYPLHRRSVIWARPAFRRKAGAIPSGLRPKAGGVDLLPKLEAKLIYAFATNGSNAMCRARLIATLR